SRLPSLQMTISNEWFAADKVVAQSRTTDSIPSASLYAGAASERQVIRVVAPGHDSVLTTATSSPSGRSLSVAADSQLVPIFITKEQLPGTG
ncbi:MAG: hypothetical protein AB7U73_23520, partial [Pirellulales bacterium]